MAGVYLGLAWFALVVVSGSEAVFSHPKVAREAKLGEFPWQVLLLNGVDGHQLLGSGTIMSRFFVLTVCPRLGWFSKVKPPEYLYSNTRVIAGTIYRSVDDIFANQGFQLRWIFYWEEHPKCRTGGDTSYWTYDVSAIKVREQFIFNELVAPIPFNRDRQEMHRQVEEIIKNDSKCTFAGWGFYKYRHIDMRFRGQVDDDGAPLLPVYYPHPEKTTTCKECYPKTLRVIDMLVMSDEACYNRSEDLHYRDRFLYRRPEDSLCFIGRGKNGGEWEMKRSGRPGWNDHGGTVVCETPNGPLAIGHLSYAVYECTLRYTDHPSVLARYDDALHPWVNKYYSPSMFDNHWVEPEFPLTKRYCPHQTYIGPIPPDL